MANPPTPHQATVQIAGTQVTLETGKIARQATAAVVARAGDHVLLATVVAADAPREGALFFPLTVEYREKLAAAGRIPGSFQRREGRISDHEVLISRLIDRSVRSLFPEGYRNEVQIQVTVLSAEPAGDPTTLGIVAAGAALHLSSVPFRGPVAGMRVVRHGGSLVAFPTQRHRDEGDLDFVVSLGPDGLVMVEGEAAEVAEAECLSAMEQAAQWVGKLQKACDELREKAGREKQALPPPAPAREVPAEVRTAMAQALAVTAKQERRAAVAAAEQRWVESLPEDEREAAAGAAHDLVSELVRERILAEGKRLDGRGLADVRPIWCEAGWLPRPHGSAIFTRGETQALVTCTLGSNEDAQAIEGLGGMRSERFLLHYNFPPYSVGEIRPLRGPGRREIGHGFLARRGLERMLPPFADFPYTIRIESDISESNGSSSMATVCGGTLAMLDAGVPLRRPVAGIAMGLIGDGERLAVLSDILGDEDHLGDMDFKVVGTSEGVTALQLDNKIGGLTFAQLGQALQQAAAGRAHILAEMRNTLAEPRREMHAHAPRVQRTAIMPDSIGALVGTRGANIKAIQAATGSRVSVGDDGVVLVYTANEASSRSAMRMVLQHAGIVQAQKYYRGTVTGVKDFGVFVRINQVNEGLVPNGEIEGDRDAIGEGAPVVVKVLGVDDRGRLRLSLRQAAGVDEALIEF